MADSVWTDGPSEMHQCISCRNTTRSHGLRATVVSAEKGNVQLEPTTDEDSDYVFTVCHTCYSEKSPEDILGEYASEVSNHTDVIGTDYDDVEKTMKSLHGRVNQGNVYMGQDTIKDVLPDLSEGDLVTLNDDGPWAIIPTDTDKKAQLPGEVVYGLVKQGGNRHVGGGIMYGDGAKSDTLYHAYEGNDGLDFEKIEKMEVHE